MEVKQIYTITFLVIAVGMLLGVGILTLDKFGIAARDTTSIYNETVAFAGCVASLANDDITAISALWNGSDSFSSANYSYTTAGVLTSEIPTNPYYHTDAYDYIDDFNANDTGWDYPFWNISDGTLNMIILTNRTTSALLTGSWNLTTYEVVNVDSYAANASCVDASYYWSLRLTMANGSVCRYYPKRVATMTENAFLLSNWSYGDCDDFNNITGITLFARGGLVCNTTVFWDNVDFLDLDGANCSNGVLDGNENVTDCGGLCVPYIQDGSYTANYTYDADGSATAAASSVSTELGTIASTWLGLIIVIAVLAIIIGLVISSFKFRG